MRIAVLGTGPVGQTVAAKLAELGHDVTVGTRSVEAAMARTEPDNFGNPPFPAWAGQHPQIAVSGLAEAASGAELVINATNGSGAVEALETAGEENLAGKVLVDIANPLDFSAGFPPTLFVKDTDSLGEQVQRAFPEAKVVKTLNTLTASLMVQPKTLGEESSVFVSGDDADAKATVVGLLESFGHADVIDLGGIETARGTEMILPVWLRLMGALGTATFNLKVVR
jgi:predicted dinucleotide-binding enzyme